MEPASVLESGQTAFDTKLHREISRTPSCVRIEAGQFLIDSAGRTVPGFLLRANQAVNAGCPAQALEQLSEDKLNAFHLLLEDDPSRIDLLYMLVKLLLATGRADQAAPWCRRIIDLEPSHVACFHMALVYRGMRDSVQSALGWARRAFEAKPDCAMYADVYARCLTECELVAETLDLLDYLYVHELADAPVLEGILAQLLYCRKTTRPDLMRGYSVLGQALARKITPITSHRNDPDPRRRIRVGFVSPDFRRNSTAIPFEVFLDGVNHEVLEVYTYGNVSDPDWVTQRIQAKVDRYFDITGMSSARIAEMIAGHGVDILVALGGYVKDHRLEVMAYKPAPVQADFGWVTTTGLDAVDYRITDAVLDPPATQAQHAEKLIYLSGGSSVFIPPEASSLVGPQPAQHNGYVTFGSFNRRIKMTDEILETWAEILRQIPDSRLIIKSPEDDTPQLQTELKGRLQDLGVPSHRIDVYGACAYHAYLDIMSQVDIALDTFPFNGAITSFECLWMGIPVVTLTGELFSARMGLNILCRLGLELFSATSPAEYVAKACSFARQIDSLARIRQSLRTQMLSSSLCDPSRLAREMENGFRRMWQHWCENTGRQAPTGQVSAGLSP